MNYFYKQDGSKKVSIIFMMFIFVLLSNVSVFGQTVVENNTTLNNTIENITTKISADKQENTSNASNMNFVLWFMGSKQNPNAAILPVGVNMKRQFITSGLAPNRVLIKAFLKKAVNFERSVA